MDDVKPKIFGEQQDGLKEAIDTRDFPPQADGAALPKKRKARHKKFIDLQKQPPKPKPLVQE